MRTDVLTHATLAPQVNRITRKYRVNFELMERQGLLHVDRPGDVAALRDVYLSKIQADLDLWVVAWNAHKISSVARLRDAPDYVYGIPNRLFLTGRQVPRMEVYHHHRPPA